jgi:hypothetical protein
MPPTPTSLPEKPAASPVTTLSVDRLRLPDPPETAPPVASAPASRSAPPDPPRATAIADLIAARWPWIAATAFLLAAAAGFWIWRTRYSPYDAAGLPRGPRL